MQSLERQLVPKTFQNLLPLLPPVTSTRASNHLIRTGARRKPTAARNLPHPAFPNLGLAEKERSTNPHFDAHISIGDANHKGICTYEINTLRPE